MKAFWEECLDHLKDSGIEDAGREFCLLGAAVCACSYEEFRFGNAGETLTALQKEKLWTFVQRRAQHEPFAKIVGKASFWKSYFFTGPQTLDPRPESELFLEVLLKIFRPKDLPLSFLDLGTGTGCLLLSSLMEYPFARGLGVDRSSKALEIAQKNAHFWGLTERCSFEQGNWNESVNGLFDVILSNPPYIRDNETLPPDVLFDPPEALFAGPDGLNAYREIFAKILKNMHQQSLIFVEIGFQQSLAVQEIAMRSGLFGQGVFDDFQNIPRLVVFGREPDLLRISPSGEIKKLFEGREQEDSLF
ncbi:release factor glutamine methyltransferase [Alphaproteobacteria bacterium]|nr:release factor glutamine methyltransferase [Alphaproteobacteria bacterium]GHS99474.1 release factor glutamine methyltransferase [Alphaproteobacteria bacterium]